MQAEFAPLKIINGLGEKSIKELNKANIFTAKDLFLSFPYRYDFFEPMTLKEAYYHDKVCLVGKIVSPLKYQYYRARLSSLTFSMSVNDEIIKVIIFNRQYLMKQLRPNDLVKIAGKYNRYKKEIIAQEVFPKKTDSHIVPYYHIKNLNYYTIGKAVNNALKMGINLDDDMPDFLMRKYQFLPLNEMILKLHNPTAKKDIEKAIFRRKYEEILDFYIKLNYYIDLKEKAKREAILYDIKAVKSLISTIPFELTEDQKAVTNQIFKTFKSNFPLNMLVQGDVGSGKTIVALIASYAMVTAKKQVILMAPTEILARQHYEYFQKFLAPFDVKVSLFTGSTKVSERKKLLKAVEDNTCQIVIGTHALYYEDFRYHNLGLAIIDEQHRFGVNARNKLLNNGDAVDALYLSATPIPRTLALTIFSDLDIATIKSVRANKKAITTKVLTTEQLDLCFKHLERELALGHQAYFITSAIESFEERYDLDDVKNLLLQRFPNLRVGVMHGKLKDSEKQALMNAYVAKELDVLVSTTVIEVGISVDNATLIVVIDSQNFGLAQLHQLRGRVGRGNLEGYCYLVTNNLDTERLKVLEESNDGFYLAEMDLKLRGPGEYFGMRQSGMSEFVFADFNQDLELFKVIGVDAKRLYLLANDDKKCFNYVEKVLKNGDFRTNLN